MLVADPPSNLALPLPTPTFNETYSCMIESIEAFQFLLGIVWYTYFIELSVPISCSWFAKFMCVVGSVISSQETSANYIACELFTVCCIPSLCIYILYIYYINISGNLSTCLLTAYLSWQLLAHFWYRQVTPVISCVHLCVLLFVQPTASPNAVAVLLMLYYVCYKVIQPGHCNFNLGDTDETDLAKKGNLYMKCPLSWPRSVMP